ncbi:MAG: TatD family hydrolase, partial [Candidatus Cloacimonetes bacterium]|nr:TatD family hydrolase [Candidatus Cloacimonadota bacterium]
MFDYGWIDAHCHLTDERIFRNHEEEISSAESVGISGFISSVLSKDEYEYIKLPEFRKLRKFIYWSAGIHPSYERSSENDVEYLVKLCDEKQIMAIGEIGLDKRISNSDWQKKILLLQLDLARNYHLPVIFHVVGNYYELLKILKKNFPNIFGFIHGFNSSQEVFDNFSKFDLGFSLNLQLPKQEVIKMILKRGFCFFETDAPFQKENNSKEEFNHLKNLLIVVEKVSGITGISKKNLRT